MRGVVFLDLDCTMELFVTDQNNASEWDVPFLKLIWYVCCKFKSPLFDGHCVALMATGYVVIIRADGPLLTTITDECLGTYNRLALILSFIDIK